jgi:AcrR family transcriptional regulator
MVDRIVAAGRAVLVDDGYDAFSTNRVAARAGVSPGSLYQYFPDKGAIVDVVVDRYWEEVAERVAASLADRIADFGPTAVRETADALLAALEDDPALLRVVARELPLSRNHARLEALERRVRDLVATYLAVRPEASTRPTPAVTAWVVVIAMEQLAVRWVLDRPSVTREQLLDEVQAFVTGYLGPVSPGRR